MSEEPLRPATPPQPTHDFLLAQALDACIEAERQLPGSAEEILDEQPGWAQQELRRLLDLACSLDAASTNALISENFRAVARARLMKRIASDLHAPGPRPLIGPILLPSRRLVALPPTNGQTRSANGALPKAANSLQRRRWVLRGTASLLAAVVACAATLTASASSLPGEPLYSLKQAQEELGVRLAADDQARTRALLNRADARLDETSRLLQLGRADDAALAAQRYDQTVQQAATTYAVTADDTPHAPPVVADFDLRLSQQQEHLQSLLQAAPEPARADLQEALVATGRTRALVTDPRPVDRAANRRGRDAAALAAPDPTPAAQEQSPTPAAIAAATAAPTQTSAAVLAQRRDGDDDRAGSPVGRIEPRNADEDRGARGGRNGGDTRGDDTRPGEDRTAVAEVANNVHRPAVTSASGRNGGDVQSPSNRGRGSADAEQQDAVDDPRPPAAAVLARTDTANANGSNSPSGSNRTTSNGGNGGNDGPGGNGGNGGRSSNGGTSGNGGTSRNGDNGGNRGNGDNGGDDDRHDDSPPPQVAVAGRGNGDDARGRDDTPAKADATTARPTVVARAPAVPDAPAKSAGPAFTSAPSERNDTQGRASSTGNTSGSNSSSSGNGAGANTSVQVARPSTPTPSRAQHATAEPDKNAARPASSDSKGRGGGH